VRLELQPDLDHGEEAVALGDELADQVALALEHLA
jgi:hypothetical protein